MQSSQLVRGINLGLAFLLELAALAALGYWGYCTGDSTFTSLLLGIGAPLLAAIAWGLFAAPKSVFRNRLLAIATKAVVFGAAFLALASKDLPGLAVIFGALVIANLILLAYMKPTSNRKTD